MIFEVDANFFAAFECRPGLLDKPVIERVVEAMMLWFAVVQRDLRPDFGFGQEG